MACDALSDKRAARRHWKAAATFRGDFQEMSVRPFSEMTYFSAMAWGRLGRPERQQRLLKELLAYAKGLYAAEARIDYFATSLPTMLLFEDDLQARQETRAMVLEAQARLGTGQQGPGPAAACGRAEARPQSLPGRRHAARDDLARGGWQGLTKPAQTILPNPPAPGRRRRK